MKPAPHTQLLVACLCADWCGACREYQPVFDSLALKFPTVRFLWVDVEDEADLIDPIEVEDFPTILIAGGETPFFFGTVLPHIETLERLIQDKMTDDVHPPVKDAAVVKLIKSLQQNVK
ncbi:MAG: thioredoxin family protein [Burkholderiaceae bacterium]